MTTEFERITKFFPAYDKRDSDPSKNYGIGGMRCAMVLKGEKGAVHFIFGMPMYLPHVHKELVNKDKETVEVLLRPMGHDVGYHSPTPLREGQEVVWPTKMKKKNPNLPDPGLDATPEQRTEYFENIEWEKIGDKPPVCDWLGVPCYSDGSALQADEWMQIFLKEGSDKIWSMLEQEYKDTFEHEDRTTA